MKLVDMRGLKPRLFGGPSSSLGTGNVFYKFCITH